MSSNQKIFIILFLKPLSNINTIVHKFQSQIVGNISYILTTDW